MENPIKMDDLGVPPFKENTQYVFFLVTNLVTFHPSDRHTFGQEAQVAPPAPAAAPETKTVTDNPCGLSFGTQGEKPSVSRIFLSFFFG